jgi:hypothetical protein
MKTFLLPDVFQGPGAVMFVVALVVNNSAPRLRDPSSGR